MKHFLIYTNKHKDQELATTKRIRDYLESKGCTVKLKVKEADWKEETDSGVEEEATDIPLDVDCMIVLGGDGTVLQAARETKKNPGAHHRSESGNRGLYDGDRTFQPGGISGSSDPG